MKYSRITAALAAAGVMLALCGCADSGSSSSERISSQVTTQPASADSVFKTNDGLFTFVPPARFKQYEGMYPADFEFLLTDSNANTTLGIIEMSGLHISPEFYCETVKAHYEEEYGTVHASADSEGDLPAYLLKAEFTDEEEQSDFLFYHKAIGYGNGDLLVLVVTVPKDKPEEATLTVEEMMSHMTYNGEALKTEPEVHDNEFFTVTADKDWYFHSKDESEATLRPNIANTLAERYGSFKISAEKSELSAKETADKDAEEFGSTDKITDVAESEGAEYLGKDAVCVTCVLNSEYMNLRRDIYYFENSGAVYKAQILAPVECFDEFSATLGSLTDSIEVK